MVFILGRIWLLYNVLFFVDIGIFIGFLFIKLVVFMFSEFFIIGFRSFGLRGLRKLILFK